MPAPSPFHWYCSCEFHRYISRWDSHHRICSCSNHVDSAQVAHLRVGVVRSEKMETWKKKRLCIEAFEFKKLIEQLMFKIYQYNHNVKSVCILWIKLSSLLSKILCFSMSVYIYMLQKNDLETRGPWVRTHLNIGSGRTCISAAASLIPFGSSMIQIRSWHLLFVLVCLGLWRMYPSLLRNAMPNRQVPCANKNIQGYFQMHTCFSTCSSCSFSVTCILWIKSNFLCMHFIPSWFKSDTINWCSVNDVHDLLIKFLLTIELRHWPCRQHQLFVRCYK